MSGKPPTSDALAQSIKQRLLNFSAKRGEVFNIVLVRFAIERLLYRLTKSPHADAFVLKGAVLFAVWADKPYRPTQDLDLLGFGTPSAERLGGVFRGLCELEVEPDGVVFAADRADRRLRLRQGQERPVGRVHSQDGH